MQTVLKNNNNRDTKRQRLNVDIDYGDQTVEENLKELKESYKKEIRLRAEGLVSELRSEYERQAAQLKASVISQSQGIASLQFELTVLAQTPSGQDFQSPYQGKEWKFSLSDGDSIPIGRSKAKKYLNSGISMAKDLEVSSGHGKIEFKKGKLYYVDVGSSNGSWINGTEINEDEKSKSFEVKNEDLIVIGETELKLILIFFDFES